MDFSMRELQSLDMVSRLQGFQMNLFFMLKGVAIVTTIFTLLSRSLSQKRRRLLFAMGLSSFLYVVFEIYSYRFRGDASHLGFYVVRISNFMIFLMPYIIVYIFTNYLSDMLINEGGLKKIPRVLDLILIFTFLGSSLVVLSQFTGLYYTVDFENLYSRTNATFWISYICPAIIFPAHFYTIIKYGKNLKKCVRISLLTFIVMPVLATIAQFFLYGLSLTSVSLVLPLIYMFIIELMDMDRTVSEVREQKIEELNERQSDYQKMLDHKSKEIERIKGAVNEANYRKASFITNMSNDIKTPLNNIIEYTGIALKNENKPETVDECLHKIKKESLDLSTFMDDILDVTLVESDNFELSEEPFSIKEAEEGVMDIFLSEAIRKNVSFEIENVNLSRDVVVHCKSALAMITVNLISNAIKFTNPGGHVKLIIEETDNNYNLIVEDNGIGISEEFLETIYEPFEREKNAVGHRLPGTGLGMTIVKKLVDKMGGSIEIKSKKRVGTRITVALPLVYTCHPQNK